MREVKQTPGARRNEVEFVFHFCHGAELDATAGKGMDFEAARINHAVERRKVDQRAGAVRNHTDFVRIGNVAQRRKVELTAAEGRNRQLRTRFADLADVHQAAQIKHGPRAGHDEIRFARRHRKHLREANRRVGHVNVRHVQGHQVVERPCAARNADHAVLNDPQRIGVEMRSVRKRQRHVFQHIKIRVGNRTPVDRR